jgi:hypothetical protein
MLGNSRLLDSLKNYPKVLECANTILAIQFQQHDAYLFYVTAYAHTQVV